MNKQATIAEEKDVAVIDNDTGLVLPEEVSTSLATLKSVSENLEATKKKYKKAPDCSTPEGYEKAKQEQNELAAVRLNVAESHKIGKKPFWDRGKEIDAMKNSITEVIGPLEESRKAAIKVIDDEKERIEWAEANAAQLHIDYVMSCIKNVQDMAKAITLDAVEHSLESLTKFDMVEMVGHEEPVQEAIDEARAELTDRRAALQAQADQKAENDRQSAANATAEKELADRMARIEEGEKRLADAQKAEQDKKDKEAADKTAEVKRQADEAQKANAKKVEAKRRANLLPDQEKFLEWVDAIAGVPKATKVESKAKAAELAQTVIDMRKSILSMTAEK